MIFEVLYNIIRVLGKTGKCDVHLDTPLPQVYIIGKTCDDNLSQKRLKFDRAFPVSLLPSTANMYQKIVLIKL